MSAQPKRFTEEFKIEAVRQVTERGHRVADVAEGGKETMLEHLQRAVQMRHEHVSEVATPE